MISDRNSIEMKTFSKLEAAETTAAVADSLNFAGILSMFFNEKTLKFLETFGKFGMFSAAMLGSIVEFAFACKHFKDNPTINTATNVAVKGIKALGISVAVILGFVGFATISPYIFGGVLTYVTLHHAKSAVSHALAGEFKEAKEHAKAAFLTALSTAAVVGVMLIGGPIVTLVSAAVGIATAIAGIGLAIFRFSSEYKKRKNIGDGRGSYEPVPTETNNLGPSIQAKFAAVPKPKIDQSSLVTQSQIIATSSQQKLKSKESDLQANHFLKIISGKRKSATLNPSVQYKFGV